MLIIRQSAGNKNINNILSVNYSINSSLTLLLAPCYFFNKVIVRSLGYLGSSETIRGYSLLLSSDSPAATSLCYESSRVSSQDVTFNYHDTPINHPSYFLDWFIGFVEGDGGFYFDPNSASGQRLIFKIRQKDCNILFKIRGYFKFGSIFQSSDGYWTYSVQSKAHIKVLINVFNGRLLLKKTNERFLNEWINNSSILGSDIIYKGKGAFVGFHNAWLCGFTDSDGSLGFHLQKDSSRSCGFRLRVKWYIDQSFELPFLELIRSHLGFGSIEIKRLSKSSFKPSVADQAYRLKTDNFNNCFILRSYFNKFPPLTNKLHIRYIRWLRVLKWVELGEWQNHIYDIKHLILLNSKLS
jgi:hypothetical protein